MGEVLGGKNVFSERLYRKIKNEEVFLCVCGYVPKARATIGNYWVFYNTNRRHSRFDHQAPNQAYFNWLPLLPATA
jgi:putative transposase